jgi:hypothetical protein
MNKREILHEYFAKLGRKSGKARMKTMTPKERSRVAAAGARARWSKAKGKTTGKGSG